MDVLACTHNTIIEYFMKILSTKNSFVYWNICTNIPQENKSDCKKPKINFYYLVFKMTRSKINLNIHFIILKKMVFYIS